MAKRTWRHCPGRTAIRASFNHLAPANGFGPEYLTYVLWAITPEGRPINLGEVLPGKNGKDQITVTTNLEAFGLIVTAEPYFAVTMPSDVVVAQNEVLHGKTEGEIGDVDVHYSLLPRGAYEQTAGRHEVLHPIRTDERSPLELYEAENAVQIAETGGADQYAADTMTTAKQALENAEGYDHNKHDRKQTITYAREAVQTAEDARIITIRKLKTADEQAQQQARAHAEQVAAQAQQTAAQEAAARAQAEQAAQQAQQEQQQARRRQPRRPSRNSSRRNNRPQPRASSNSGPNNRRSKWPSRRNRRASGCASSLARFCRPGRPRAGSS